MRLPPLPPRGAAGDTANAAAAEQYQKCNMRVVTSKPTDEEWRASLGAAPVDIWRRRECQEAGNALGIAFGWMFALAYIVAPYFVYAMWLTFVTYMQHVSPEVPVYDRKDWTSLKGALATVDRNYGPFNWLTHNIGNLHVIHHIFPTIPHYYAKEATEAVKPVLGDWYMKSDRFVLGDFMRTLIGCHYVEHGDGQEVWKSAYGWAANHGANGKDPDDDSVTAVPAE